MVKVTSSNLEFQVPRKVWSGPLIYNKKIKSGESIKSKLYPRVFFTFVFLLLIVIAFYLVRPFLSSILTGAILAYIFYPLHKKSLKYFINPKMSAFVVTAFIFFIIVVPSILALGFVLRESLSTYKTLDSHKLGTNFMKVACQNPRWLSCRSMNFLIGFLPVDNLDYYLQDTIAKITGFIINSFSSFLLSTLSIMLNMFVMVFVIYYLLKDAPAISKKIKRILPLNEPHKQHILDKFHNITFAVFYGNLFTALLQGIAGILGFVLFGVSSPILWGFVMIFFALMPYIGSAIIWAPAALNLIFVGYLQNDNSFTVRGILLLLYGIVVITSIDHIVKPKVIGKEANVHPILVLIGILGGLSMFGFIGVILGPVMLALLVTFIEIYEEDREIILDYFT